MKLHKSTFPIINPYKPYYAAAIALMAASVSCNITALYFLAELLANFLKSRMSSSINTGHIIFLAGAWGLKIIFSSVSDLLLAKASYGIRDEIRSKLLRSELFVSGESSGKGKNGNEVLFTIGVDSLDSYFRLYLPSLYGAIIAPLLIGATACYFDSISGIVLLFTLPLIPLFMVLIGMAVKNKAMVRWKEYKILGEKYLNVLEGLATLKAFAQSKIQEMILEKNEQALADSTLNVLKISFLSAFVLEIIGTLSIAVVAVFCGVRLLNKTIPFEHAMFVLLIIPDFFMALRQMGLNFHAAANGFIVLDNIEPYILDHKVNSTVVQNNSLLEQTEEKSIQALEIKNLTFSFAKEQTQFLFKNLNFSLQKNEKCALLGNIGSGKSTLLKIIMGLLEPSEGEIFIHREGDAVYSPKEFQSWHKHFAWCPQRFGILSGTMKENLLFANPQASENELKEALEFACLANFVSGLPQKLDTAVGENGFRLSMGEKQRLVLARTFLSKRNIILLDEPTAFLDKALEKEIITNIKYAFKSKLALIVTHREMTRDLCDREISLENNSGIYTNI